MLKINKSNHNMNKLVNIYKKPKLKYNKCKMHKNKPMTKLNHMSNNCMNLRQDRKNLNQFLSICKQL